MRRSWLIVVVVFAIGLSALGFAAPETPSTESMAQPQYDEDGALLLPKDYDDWVFVGASIGLSYSEKQEKHEGPGTFHNVYMQPEAYRYYKTTGEFAEETMFVMTNYAPSNKSEILRAGHFEGKMLGLEVALKDTKRFLDDWAYYNFSSPVGLKEKAKPFPRQVCWDCHAEHGEVDNVFVQYYPMLREKK